MSTTPQAVLMVDRAVRAALTDEPTLSHVEITLHDDTESSGTAKAYAADGTTLALYAWAVEGVNVRLQKA